MTAVQTRQRLIVTAETRPAFPRHIKLKYDKERNRWVILAPERVFNPDPIAVTILNLVNGHRNVLEISCVLAQNYDAPLDAILADTLTMLQDLADKGVVTANPEAHG